MPPVENDTHIKYKIELKTLDGKPYEIQAEGSLGLLALGYKGLLGWRQKRDSIVSQKNSPTKKGEPNQLKSR